MASSDSRNAPRSADLRPEWIAAFVRTVETGSLAAAGRALHRSPSAMTMQIGKLEAALGATLLHRDARGVSTTSHGERLLPHARELLAAQQRARDAVADAQAVGGVRLGVPEDYAQGYLPAVLRGFARTHPGIELTLVCEQSTALIPALSRGEIDVAILTRDRRPLGTPLFDEPMAWIGPPDGAIWRQDPLPVALFEPGSVARAATERALRAAGRRYRIAYQSPGDVGQIAAVRSGLAVAALTRCSIPRDLRVLGTRHGLPRLPAMPVVAALGARPSHPAAARALHERIVQALTRR